MGIPSCIRFHRSPCYQHGFFIQSPRSFRQIALPKVLNWYYVASWFKNGISPHCCGCWWSRNPLSTSPNIIQGWLNRMLHPSSSRFHVWISPVSSERQWRIRCTWWRTWANSTEHVPSDLDASQQEGRQRRLSATNMGLSQRGTGQTQYVAILIHFDGGSRFETRAHWRHNHLMDRFYRKSMVPWWVTATKEVYLCPILKLRLTCIVKLWSVRFSDILLDNPRSWFQALIQA